MKQKAGKKGRPALATRGAAARADTRGRIHLALHRDPASGRESAALEHALFSEDWQNQVASAAANTAYEELRERPSVSRAIDLARSVMASTSRLADGLLAKAPAGSVACRAGCDHCCYQAVGVTAPEALAIVAHLRSTLSGAELARLASHVAEAHERTRGLSSAQRFSPDHPCVFLEAARCSIYDVRPLACRGMNSLDAGECSKRLHEPAARDAFLANGAGSHSFQEPIRAFHAVSAGLQLGLSELFGLDMRPLELIAAVHLLLSCGESIGRDWIAGKDAFEPARGGENTPQFEVLAPQSLAPSHLRDA
jgi:Fe-S-cluster containining protein